MVNSMKVFNLADKRFLEFSYKMRFKLLQLEVNLQNLPNKYHMLLKQLGLMTEEGSLNLDLFKPNNLQATVSKSKALLTILKNNPTLPFEFLQAAGTCTNN